MIGGRDIVIRTSNPLAALEVAMRAVRRVWPAAVLEDGSTGETLEPYEGPSLAGRSEVLAFKDAAASRLWAEAGAGPDTRGTLIHLLISTDDLTMVVDDDPTPEMRQFVRSVSHALAQNLFSGFAPREPA